MNEEPTKLDQTHTATAPSISLVMCIAAYLLYALFLLIECLDFSALLHSPEPGYHATYDIHHVIFYVLDLIVCLTFGLILMIVHFAPHSKPSTVVWIVILITILRTSLIYYLYMFKADNQLAPFIYKKANEMSGIVRTVMLPLQIFVGLGCSWRWIRRQRKQPVPFNGVQ